MLVSDFITNTLVQMGELGQGETPSAEDLANGFTQLNNLYDLLSGQRLNIPSVTRNTYTLTSGNAGYSIGPTSAQSGLVGPRPIKIQGAECILPITGGGTLYSPINILTSKQYEQVRDKALQSAIITDIYEEGGLINHGFYTYPVPNTARQIVMELWYPLPQFATLSSTFSVPVGGYAEMLQWNLADMISIGYGRGGNPMIAQKAAATLQAVQKMNSQLLFTAYGESRTLNGADTGFAFNPPGPPTPPSA